MCAHAYTCMPPCLFLCFVLVKLRAKTVTHNSSGLSGPAYFPCPASTGSNDNNYHLLNTCCVAGTTLCQLSRFLCTKVEPDFQNVDNIYHRLHRLVMSDLGTGMKVLVQIPDICLPSFIQCITLYVFIFFI